MEERVSVQDRAKAPPNKRARAGSGEPATAGGSRSLWFSPPIDDPDRRPQLTRTAGRCEPGTTMAVHRWRPGPRGFGAVALRFAPAPSRLDPG